VHGVEYNVLLNVTMSGRERGGVLFPGKINGSSQGK
jgi:hypothetical protein